MTMEADALYEDRNNKIFKVISIDNSVDTAIAENINNPQDIVSITGEDLLFGYFVKVQNKLPIGINIPDYCNHDWIDYTGLFHSDRYCKKCYKTEESGK